VFRGVSALLSQIKELCDRPHRSKPVPGVEDGDRPLPLLCLVRGAEPNTVLTDLGGRLTEASDVKVPLALVEADVVEERVATRWEGTDRVAGPLLPLVDELRHRLAANRFGYRRLTRFRHYRLADWLTGRRLTPGENRNERVDVTDMLRLWHGRADRPATGTDAAVADTVATQSTWLKLALLLGVAWHRPLRFWLWSHGVPVFGREPRWLMRQPFMVPGHSTSFTGFAERLTVGRRAEENLEQIKKLLVHAFLQDLRAAYGSGTWRLRRWRRTAYTVVLLEGITEENGGWELLRLVNDVRNESTEHDPVLFVATAAEVPDWLTVKETLPPVNRLVAEVDDWYQNLPARRQSLRGDARFITVGLPGASTGPVPTDEDEAAWRTCGDIRPRPVAVLARRSFIVSVVAAIAIAAGLVGGVWAAPRWKNDCLPSPRSGVATAWMVGYRDKEECVGYSDSAAQVFGDDDRLRKAQLAVFESNADAEDLHEEKPSRPVVTVVYFSEFTTPAGWVGTADAVAEELTGILAQQHLVNIKSEQSEPLLRVVVANGGYRMDSARRVADEFLAPLFANDPTAMGVLGMGRTVEATESAIGALGDLGIPVVANALTGEGLTGRSPMYFQLVAGNKKQIDMVKAFAAGREITLYRPADLAQDSYLASLVKEMGDGADVVTWEEGQVSGVRPTCEPNRIAFFAGRESEFGGFLDRVVECTFDTRPVVLGDDAVSRFVAQGSNRQKETYARQAVSYVSLGSVVVTGNGTCYQDGPGEVTVLCRILRRLRSGNADDGPAWRDFGAALRENSAPWVGERVGISFDGAGLFVRAVAVNQTGRDRRDASGLAPNRAAIVQEMRELPCPQGKKIDSGKCYDGVSGLIDFSADRDGRSRPISILRVADIGDRKAVPECVFMVPKSPECPNSNQVDAPPE